MNHTPESPLFCGSRFLEDSVSCFETDVVIRCGLPPGHKGRHEFFYSAEWGDQAAFVAPESPPECEALLAEALETLAKFPRAAELDGISIESWYYERARPAQVMIEAFLFGVDPPDSVTPST